MYPKNFYCKNCNALRTDEETKNYYCNRLNCKILGCKKIIETIIIRHNNLIRQKIYNTYEAIINNENPSFPNYNLTDYFNDLDMDIQEITEEYIKKYFQ